MNTISIREVHELDDNSEIISSGYVADIQPPVALSESAVKQYIRHGRLDEIGSDDRLVNPMLIGSSDTQTSIYAACEYGYEDDPEVKELFANRTQRLLGHLGIGSVILDF